MTEEADIQGIESKRDEARRTGACLQVGHRDAKQNCRSTEQMEWLTWNVLLQQGKVQRG